MKFSIKDFLSKCDQIRRPADLVAFTGEIQNKNKIKHLHERCLRLIHNDKLSSYEELLEKDGSVSIHHKNIQSLATEMFHIF